MKLKIDTIEVESKSKLSENSDSKKIDGIELRYYSEAKGLYYYKVKVHYKFKYDIQELYDSLLYLFSEPVITRVDFAFDEYEVDYDTKFKFIQLYISCFSKYLNIKNNYVSFDFMQNNKALSIKADFGKHGNYALEYYNKIEERERKDETTDIKSRFEIRLRNLSLDLEQLESHKKLTGKFIDIIEKEVKLMHTAVQRNNFSATVSLITDNLIEGFKTYKSQNLRSYLAYHQNLCYTSSILSKCFKSVYGEDNFSQYASDFKTAECIQTFSRKHLDQYTAQLEACKDYWIEQVKQLEIAKNT